MPRYIDADALKAYVSNKSTHWLNEWDTVGVLTAVDKQPTIEARPVVRGEWILTHGEDGLYYDCSVCGHCAGRGRKSNFCPKCGADMRGGENAGS